MNIDEFVKKVRKKLKHDNFHFYTVDYLQKSGIINPTRKGSGRPREFSNEDVKKAVEYYSE